MAKEAVKSNSSKTPDAVKAKPDAPESKEIAISVKAGAMSTDIGPVIVSNMQKLVHEEDKLNVLKAGIEQKRYDTLSQLTMAAVKAAKADDTINLAASITGDVKQMNLLNEQLQIALGVKAYIEVKHPETGKVTKKLQYTKAVEKFFPSKRGPKDDPKNTFRTNWVHQLKKAASAACAVMDKGIDYKMDPKAGTLMISGPAVVERFGHDNVLLNEKQKYNAGDEGEVQLKAKPSFTALRDIAAEVHNKTPAKPAPAKTPGPIDPDPTSITLCNQLTSVLNMFNGTHQPKPDTLKALSGLATAIDRVRKL